MFFSEFHLETREGLIRYFTRCLELQLTKVNPAFRFIRIETPILIPSLRINTTKAAFDASRDLLDAKVGPKFKLPIVVWQHGKVFRKRSNGYQEHYNLEFHILFSKTTNANYFPGIVRSCETALRKQCGKIFTADEDATGVSIFAVDEDTELVHIRENSEFWGGKCIEIILKLDDVTRINTLYEYGRIRRSALDKK